jgi:hypothetical protein
MLKDKLQIVDSMFSHAHSSSWYNHPTEFTWVRENHGDVVVFTDTSVDQVDRITKNKKYAWLLESPLITSSQYNFIKNNFDKFDSIFTFDNELLELSPKFKLVPLGGCWVKKEDRLVHKKSKLVSTIVSNKKFLPGHTLRHDIVNNFTHIDVFGGGYNPIENKIIGLKDYRFHIVVENCKKNYYFSEKLIDCFVTGTIPIYWGCPSIGDFFDLDGILTFDTLEDLQKILNSLSNELYLNKLNSINKNFGTSQNFLIADDIIYKKIKND